MKGGASCIVSDVAKLFSPMRRYSVKVESGYDTFVGCALWN